MDKDLLENEREWRRFLSSQISEIQKNQTDMMLMITTLKLKVGAVSSVFGAVGAMVVTWLSKHFQG